MPRYFLRELAIIGGATAVLLMVMPAHGVAVIIAVVVTWTLEQLVCALAFMVALHRGDIQEYRSNPRRYAAAPHARVGWQARRFMLLYLRPADMARPESPKSGNGRP